jgi:hypothetical protein
MDNAIKNNDLNKIDELLISGVTLNYENFLSMALRYRVMDHLMKKNICYFDENITNQQIYEIIKTRYDFGIHILKFKKNFCLEKEEFDKNLLKYDDTYINYSKKFLSLVEENNLNCDKYMIEYFIFKHNITDDKTLILYKKQNYIFEQSDLTLMIMRKFSKCIKYMMQEKEIIMNLQNFDFYVNSYNNVVIDDMKYVFEKIQFTEKHLEKALQAKNETVSKYLIEEKNIKISAEACNYYIIMNTNIIKNEDFDNIIFANTEPTIKHLELAFENSNLNVAYYLMKNKNIKQNEKCIEFGIKNLINPNIHKKIYENFKFNSNHLALAIKFKNTDMIEYLIKEHKVDCDDYCVMNYYVSNYYVLNQQAYDLLFGDIQFTPTMLELACEHFDYRLVSDILNQKAFLPKFKIYINKTLFSKNAQNIALNKDKVNKIFALFYQFGYLMDEDDIIITLNKEVSLDEKIIRHYMPTEKFYRECLKPELCPTACKDKYWFRKLCNGTVNTKTIPEIKRTMKKNNISPDYNCFASAKNNIYLWELFKKNIDNSVDNSVDNNKDNNKDDLKNAVKEKKPKKVTKKEKEKN